MTPALRHAIDTDPDVRELYVRYLGVLGLLAECSVYVTEDERECIERAFGHAEEYGLCWRRVLDRFSIQPAPHAGT